MVSIVASCVLALTADQITPKHMSEWTDAIFSKFDANDDGVLSRDEIAEWALSNEMIEDDAEATARVEGMMMMLDSDEDGKGTRKEVIRFLDKMKDMDGRTDRLPTGNEPPEPARPPRRKGKRGKKRKSSLEAAKERAEELMREVKAEAMADARAGSGKSEL